MPELPEVEALRLGLVNYLVGNKILEVQVLNPKIVSSSGTIRKPSKEKVREFENELKGKKVVSLERRAKNIIINLSGEGLLLVHLKMTGQLVFRSEHSRKESSLVLGGHPIQASESTLPHKHTYIIFKMENGTLYYNDIRQFGYVLYYPSVKDFEKINHFKKLGLEPFDKEFTVQYLQKELVKKKSPLKTVLLNQEVVVGCGNIYCDEVTFASRVLPARRCDELSKDEIRKIHTNIIKILTKAINSGGSSVANYLLADGKRGNYADYHAVYGKAGKPCPNCGELLSKSTLSGRTTVFCTTCQK